MHNSNLLRVSDFDLPLTTTYLLYIVDEIKECIVLQSAEAYYSLVLELKSQTIAEKLFNVSILVI